MKKSNNCKVARKPLTCLSGFPSSLLDVLFSLVAQFDLQLLRLHLQVLLPICQSLTGLQRHSWRGTRQTWIYRPLFIKFLTGLHPSISFCIVFPIICIVFPISAEIKVYKCWPISHQYRKLIKSPKWIVTLCQDYHPLLLLWLILSKNSNAFVFFLTKQL